MHALNHRHVLESRHFLSSSLLKPISLLRPLSVPSPVMDPQGLLASAAINIGLAIILLFLFSILKKQPSNAPIYYARRLATSSHPAPTPLSVSRFLPSFSWIHRAFHISEDEILETRGLDAFVVIRLFKFGIKFFSVSSILGVVLLLPMNFYSEDGSSDTRYSMDYWTISNVPKGSNRLWVHFMSMWFISTYGFYLLYMEYRSILVKRIRQLRKLRKRPDQFTILVRQIPICSMHKARGCSVDHFFSKHHPYTYHSHQMLYDCQDLGQMVVRICAFTADKNQAKYIKNKIEKLTEKCMGDKSGSRKLVFFEEKLQEVVHKIQKLQSDEMIRQKELNVAFVTFKSRHGAALAGQTQQHSNPLIWICGNAPEPRDVSWNSLSISYKLLLLQKVVVVIAASLLTIFFAIPVTAVQGMAKYEKLKQWFPPAMVIEFIPGLTSVVTGYLPSAILKGFLYIVPFAMLAMAKFSGSISRSKEEIRACNMVFYFLIGNVFFLSVISGSLLEEIGMYFNHPKEIPSHLAGAVSAQANFFVTYILTDGLSGFSLEVLQPAFLLWDFIKLHTCGRGNDPNPYLYSLPYFRIIPMVSLCTLIGIVYAVIAPLLLPFLIVYFFLGYVVYINQIEDVYETIYDTCGQYWPFIHHYVFVSIILMQITMIGLFGLKAKPAAAISTIPLLLLTIFFNEYCKIRFLPTFQRTSLQTAVENDDVDKGKGQLESSCENAAGAYRPPLLQPVSFAGIESSIRQPLIASQLV